MKLFRKAVLGNQRGMTLVEVLAVIVILSLIITVVARNVMKQSGAAKWKLNQAKMQQVQQALNQYRLELNKYPNSLQDLAKPVNTDGAAYIPTIDAEGLKDVWGFPLDYRVENNDRSYVLKTFGSDGTPGGEGEKMDLELRP